MEHEIYITKKEIESIKRLFESYNSGTILSADNYYTIETFIQTLDELES